MESRYPTRKSSPLWRVGFVVFGLLLVGWAWVDLADGRVGLGWRYGPDYEVTGLPAYLAAGGLFVAGLGCVTFGALDRRTPWVVAALALAGMLAWIAVLLYVTAAQRLG